MRYDDFVLHIGGQRPGADGAAYALRVLQSPAGEGRGLFQPPVGRAEASAFWARYRGEGLADRSTTTEATRDASVPPPPGAPILSPQEIGGRLFDAIFRDQVGGLYDRSLGSLHGTEDQGLRLKIRLDQEAMGRDDLGDLPWELLYRRETGNFLALDRRSSIVRYLDVPQPSRPIPLPERLRVLLVTAEPRGELAPLDLDAEMEKLQHEADEVPNWDLEVVRGASVDGLRAACRRRGPFHIIHFMGHGGFDPSSGDGVLYFQHPDGTAQPVSGRDLAAKLQDLDSLGLVFLNACETAMSGGADPFSGVACSLVRGGLPAVVAMQRPISDRAAILFGSTFYAALASGLCGDEALVEARQAVHSDAPGSLEWTTPVLFARLREGTLFEPPEAETGPSYGRWVALTALVLPWILVAWFFAGSGEERVEALALDQVFATSIDGVEGVVRRVEMHADGTMRVFFEFDNHSSEDATLGFDWKETYLADEHGNPYEVIRSNAPVETDVVSATIPTGESREIWIDVPAPKDGARKFGVALASDERSEVSYPFFEAEIPEYPERYGTRSEPPEILEGAEAVPVEAEIPSNLEDLNARVDRVELVAGEVMRWSLSMLNRTDTGLAVDFDPARLVLVDDQGNAYRPRAYGIHNRATIREYGFAVRRGLRADPWFEFPAPRAGAGTFSLRLATRASSLVRFEPAKVAGLDTRRFALPAPAWPRNLLPTPVAVPTSPETVETRVLGIYRASRDRMRWRLEWRNRGSADAKIGLSYPQTKVIDSKGRPYVIHAAHPEADVRSQGFEAALVPGERRDGWIDLDVPYMDAGALTLRPGNARGAASSSPVSVGAISWPGGGRRPPVEAPPPAEPPPPEPEVVETVVTTFRLADGEKVMANTLPGLRSKMISVDRLDNGRLRWNLELWNGASGVLQVGFHPGQTRLFHSDDSYRLDRTSVGPRSSTPYRRTLAPGESWRFWLEFAGDFDGGEEFTLVLGSPDTQRYRYRPVEARPDL